MMLRYRWYVLFLLAVPVAAQNVSVVATIDSQSVAIGDWIHLSLEVKNSSQAKISFPALKDTLGPFDIVKQDSLAVTKENGVTVLSKNIVIAKYEPGNFSVPAIAVIFDNGQGNRDSALSNPIPVEIRGVEVDTTQSIRDVKAPLTVPVSLAEIALYVGIAFVIIGILYGVYYYIQKKRRNGEAVESAAPKIPPHIEAFQKLEALEAEHLWQSGEVKQFYSKATEIVREYFEKRFRIKALEMTTGEVMEQLKECTIEDNVAGTIERFLSDADLVKFAKYQPIAADNEGVIPQAKIIVDATAPAEIEMKNEESAETAEVTEEKNG